jgi:hypothetical protein
MSTIDWESWITVGMIFICMFELMKNHRIISLFQEVRCVISLKNTRIQQGNINGFGKLQILWF